jgi:hypothetical protein
MHGNVISLAHVRAFLVAIVLDSKSGMQQRDGSSVRQLYFSNRAVKIERSWVSTPWKKKSPLTKRAA